MTNPIGKDSARSPYENAYGSENTYPLPDSPDSMDDSSYELSDDSFPSMEEDFSADSDFETASTAPELRKRILMMRSAIQSDASLKPELKKKLLGELAAMWGKTNLCQSLEPSDRERMLKNLNEQLSSLEMPAFGLENEDIASMAETGEEEDPELNAKSLKEDAKKARDRLEALLSSGKITSEVYDEISEKLSRFETALNETSPQLELLAKSVNDVADTLNLLDEEYLINGEKIESLPGGSALSEGDKPAPEILNNLKALLEGATKDKDLLGLLFKHYPALDSDGDGKLEMQELQKAVDTKTWPSITGPDQSLVEFLYDADKEFKTCFDQAPNDGWQSLKKATNRMVALLQALYPDKKATISAGEQGIDSRTWCGICFDGQHFTYLNVQADALADGRTLANEDMPLNSLCWTQWVQDPDLRWHPADAAMKPYEFPGMGFGLGGSFGGNPFDQN